MTDHKRYDNKQLSSSLPMIGIELTHLPCIHTTLNDVTDSERVRRNLKNGPRTITFKLNTDETKSMFVKGSILTSTLKPDANRNFKKYMQRRHFR